LTVHKAQGCTLNSALVDLSDVSGTAQPYVMLSHVRSIKKLFIVRDFPIEKIQCRMSEDLRKEFMRLNRNDILT
ncbi:hypothetical protein BJ165DRAFT_1312197, partial [Panaeolus papilionaceus]